MLMSRSICMYTQSLINVGHSCPNLHTIMYVQVICFYYIFSSQSSAARTLFSSAGFNIVGVKAVPTADGLPVWIIVVAVIVALLLILFTIVIIIIIIMRKKRLVVLL